MCGVARRWRAGLDAIAALTPSTRGAGRRGPIVINHVFLYQTHTHTLCYQLIPIGAGPTRRTQLPDNTHTKKLKAATATG